jgi:hypothetical protein
MKGWKVANLCFRWQDGLDRRYAWNIGTASVDSDKPHSWFCVDSSLREGGSDHTQVSIGRGI